MQQFNLEYQYQLYLERVSLKEENMHHEQRKQLKQAFMGACGQLLILFRDDLGGIEDEEKAIATMQDMLNQVGDYWLKVGERSN